jgi:uncharacterized phage protein (TIGR02218 family)
MSKTISAGLEAHHALPTTTLATLWKITRTDGAVFCFTDHDVDIQYGDAVYVAAQGYEPSEVQTSGRLNVDNLEIVGFLDAAGITQADLEAGKWDYARVEIARINRANTSQGVIYQRCGELGQVTVRDGRFVVELRGLMQYLQRQIGRVTAPNCDAKLGDARCGVDLDALTVSGTVTAVTSRQAFTDSALAQAEHYFRYGLVTWLTGENAGARMEVKAFAAGLVTLQLPMIGDIAIGDTFEISPGCDKVRTGDCISKFDNAINFRGFDLVPGVDRTVVPAHQ